VPFATGLVILIRGSLAQDTPSNVVKYLAELILKRNINFFFGCTTYCSNIWHVHSDGKYIAETAKKKIAEKERKAGCGK